MSSGTLQPLDPYTSQYASNSDISSSTSLIHPFSGSGKCKFLFIYCIYVIMYVCVNTYVLLYIYYSDTCKKLVQYNTLGQAGPMSH